MNPGACAETNVQAVKKRMEGKFHGGGRPRRQRWGPPSAGAIHMGRGVIERDIETQFPDKKTELVLYCAEDSLRAFRRQSPEDGLHQVISMDGGGRLARSGPSYR